jgi:hypothetical protein
LFVSIAGAEDILKLRLLAGPHRSCATSVVIVVVIVVEVDLVPIPFQFLKRALRFPMMHALHIGKILQSFENFINFLLVGPTQTEDDEEDGRPMLSVPLVIHNACTRRSPSCALMTPTTPAAQLRYSPDKRATPILTCEQLTVCSSRTRAYATTEAETTIGGA